MTDRLDRWLWAPIDPASLAVFRIVFGLCGLLGAVRYVGFGWVELLYVTPSWSFGWLPDALPAPGPWLYAVYLTLAVASVGVAAGAFRRASITLFVASFLTIELQDQTNYLNHYYLMTLVGIGLAAMPADAAWSVDGWRDPRRLRATIPAWTVNALRLQLGLVYLFAGIAKLDAQWLAGHPLDIWLATRSSLPVLGPWLVQPWLAPAMAIAGCAYDLTVPLWLALPRTRGAAYLVVVGFHVAVGVLFNIGVFPLLMIGLTPVFFDPSWPRRLAARRPVAIGAARGAARPSGLAVRRWVAPALAGWFAVQLVVPLRHLAYPGDVTWTEEGFRFAWRFLLVEKRGFFRYQVTDPATGQRWTVRPEDELTDRQRHEASFHPEMLLQYAHHLRDRFGADGHPGVRITCDAWVSVNGGASARLIDPTVDLAAEPAWTLAPRRWILPAPSAVGVAVSARGP
ncbi:MAG: HTTM domain-containing protein [Myxococcota bacterium]